MFDIKYKLFIVTGSARGLGKGFSRAILKKGGSVMLSDVLVEEGHATLLELQSEFGEERVGYCIADVTDKESFGHLWSMAEKKFNKPVDVLVNNAGVTHQVGWRKCLDVNIKGVMNGNDLAIERMSKKNGGSGGHVVNIGSTGGFVTGPDLESAAYFVSKSGVVTLTRGLGSKPAFAVTKIRFVCLCPAYADTQFLDTDIRKYIKEQSKLQILPVNAVVNGFIQLFQSGENGEVSLLVKEKLPLMTWPNYEWSFVLLSVVIGAKIWSSLGYKGVFDAKHQLTCSIGAFLLFYILLRLFVLCTLF